MGETTTADHGAADGGARARTGADGAVVLNLRRGSGAYAMLLRADGQLTRAGQHYYSHLDLRPPSKNFDYNQPLIREGPNDYILLRRSGGEHRLTKLGKGFFRDKYCEYLVQVAQRVRQQVETSLDPGGPILQLSDETYFLDPEGHWVVSTFAGLRKNQKKKTRGPKKRGPRKKGKRGFFWQSLTSLEMQPGAKLQRISRGLYFAATRLHAAF